MRHALCNSIALSMAACISTAAVAKKEQAPVDPGPQPNLISAQATTEATIKSSLYDPSSAEFQWPFAWTGGYWKPVLQGKRVGWWTCGLVNAKNRMGGYVGFQNFAVVFFNDSLVHYEVGTGREYDFTNMGCGKALQQGVLKRADTVSAVKLDPTKPSLGIYVTHVPDGLYLATVNPGYPAAQAGVQQGMVISAINGVALKGLPATTAMQILSATGADVTLTLIGRGDIKLTKSLPSGVTE